LFHAYHVVVAIPFLLKILLIRPKNFRKFACFGSIGWIVAGILISSFDLETLSTPFLIACVISFLAGLYALTLPYKAPQKTTEKVTVGQILGFDAFKLTQDRSFLVLLVFSALTCIPLAFYDSFTNLFIVNQGINNAAAAMSMGQIAEVIFLFTFPFFFSKLKYKGSITAAIIAWLIMYGCFALGAYTGLKGFLYAVLPFHGFCFTFFFVGGATLCERKSTGHIEEFGSRINFLCHIRSGKIFGNTQIQVASAKLN